MNQLPKPGDAGYWDGDEPHQDIKRRQRRQMAKSIEIMLEPTDYRMMLSKETIKKLEENESRS